MTGTAGATKGGHTPRSRASGQLQLPFRPTGRGGARPGAGRPPTGRARVPHGRRPSHSPHHPVHVTLPMARRTWNLRSDRCFRVVEPAFRRTNARGLVSIKHYSVQGNHIHLIVESRDRRALASGIKGLEVRLARGLNARMGTRGRLLGDRYHARALTSPSMVRNVLAYVLLNHAHHDPRWAGIADPYASGAAFDGWSFQPRAPWIAGAGPPPVRAPVSWLLTTGWRRHGVIDPRTIPGAP